MNLEDIMLSDVTESKDKYCMVPFIYDMQSSQIRWDINQTGSCLGLGVQEVGS